MPLYEKGFLTKVELEFLEDRANGKDVREIAREKGISRPAVREREERLKEKWRKAEETLEILRNYGYGKNKGVSLDKRD